MRFSRFVSSPEARRRYWARAMVGWSLVHDARPGRAHRALSWLERDGRLGYLVTQNVDGLHQKAGQRRVNDLHGRIDQVRCLDCGQGGSRHAFQERLLDMNPDWRGLRASYAPDGDADLGGRDFSAFRPPPCERCGGVLKPDVVFFGESVPSERVDEAMAAVDASDALLVVGSSLMVWSGYRFVRRAVDNGIRVAAVNLGKTRADGELDVKVEAECGDALDRLVASLGAPGS